MIPPDQNGDSNHSVLILSPAHDSALPNLDLASLTNVWSILSAEHARLSAKAATKYVHAFLVSGEIFGPSVEHPHAQLLALPFAPNVVSLHGEPVTCPICSDDADDRLLGQNERFRAIVPKWSRLAFELTIAPNRHLHSIHELDERDVGDLCEMLMLAIRATARTEEGETSRYPYLVGVFSGPEGELGHHLRIEFMIFRAPSGDVKRLSAMEIELGVYINPMLPATAAAELKRTVG